MTQNTDLIRTQVLEAVVTLAKNKHVYTDKLDSLVEFIQEFYFNASLEDLQTRTVESLCESVLALWRYLLQRRKQEAKVCVMNPEVAEVGWHTTNTVIMIVQEDLPFFLESILMELSRSEHPILFLQHIGNLQVERDKQGKLKNLFPPKLENQASELATFIEIKRLPDEKACRALAHTLSNVLEDVGLAVRDWLPMKQKAQEILVYLNSDCIPHGADEIFEAKEFIKWIVENHFTFLGFYESIYQSGEPIKVKPGSELGVVCRKHNGEDHEYSCFVDLDEQFSQTKEFILTGKSSVLSTVHRLSYADFISIKKYNERKELIGELKFLGLYTSSAYNWRPSYIPLLRVKVLNILNRANVPLMGHDGKAILNIIETLPRDDIFLGTEDDLFDLVMGILRLRERPKLKLFIRRDIFKRYYSCFVFVPKDRLDSDMRRRFEKLLQKAFDSSGITFTTQFSDSALARIHFMIRVESARSVEVDLEKLENELSQASRTWVEDLEEALQDHYGEMRAAELSAQCAHAFPASYREVFSASIAVHDMMHLELLADRSLSMSFYQPLEESSSALHFKTYVAHQPLPLSQIVPIFEHLGLKVISEQPHQIQLGEKTYWINDFCLMPEAEKMDSLEDVKDIFQDAFYHIWLGQAENDDFNRLVLVSGLSWREITVLRAYSKYLWQIGFTYSQQYIAHTLFEQALIARKLMDLFLTRFDPTVPPEKSSLRMQELEEKIEVDLDQVDSIDQDRILRRLRATILASLRTNYFQLNDHQAPKEYLSFKVDPKRIPDFPLPMPMFEIFVYSPRVEGIHLRHAKVARGGIRWSDRLEDYRTEILGLVKAQQVKNSVIVPMGAKGGFVTKQLPKGGTREEILNEGIACYQLFIQGLLDLTDNVNDGQTIPPENVVRYDSDDIYLVVAADKGTATFSDIANTISLKRTFWLKDAFASGGSAGYDHKKMAITARGAWESVKRHFSEMNRNIQAEDFTVVGIGDMSGDVFGNGMLLSEHIKLLAAFNHQHIFIDPTPDAAISFQERKRLFQLPRSSWSDYNSALISAGGGVFARSSKFIPISEPMRQRFGISVDKMEPNEFIRTLLMAEVDLLWNGGIGTYVKSSQETHADVGDKSNDALRVNGQALRCKVIGEGGNLGCTQLGRVEYALKGGRLNTDAIDNSGGVDCSDHEVNIKILLNAVMDEGHLTEIQRNELLVQMTDDVAELVLQHNRHQNEALSIASYQGVQYIDMHARLIDFLEKVANLNREIEFLPTKEQLMARKEHQQGLTRPELAVLLAYTKIYLKEVLLASALPEDPYIAQRLSQAFPTVLRERYQEAMAHHRLKREIIVTQVTNALIDEMGITFLKRLQDETGAQTPDIVRAYTVVREVFRIQSLREDIHSLDLAVPADLKIRLQQEMNRMIRRGTRWFLRHRRNLDIQTEIQQFSEGVRKVAETLPSVGVFTFDELEGQPVSAEFAQKMGTMGAMFSALDIVAAAREQNAPVETVVKLYFTIGARLDLLWVRDQIRSHPVNTHWDALARAAFRDDLDSKQREITESILSMPPLPHEQTDIQIEARIDRWLEKQKELVARWHQILVALQSSSEAEFTRFAVALRELRELVSEAA